MSLKPLQQTGDSFEMLTKWLSGCCLFVVDWGPEETLSLDCFFFFFLVSAFISAFGLGIYRYKDQDKQFLTRAVIAAGSACSGSAISGNIGRYL